MNEAYQGGLLVAWEAYLSISKSCLFFSYSFVIVYSVNQGKEAGRNWRVFKYGVNRKYELACRFVLSKIAERLTVEIMGFL